MEDNLKLKKILTQKKRGRRPKPINQSTKINLIGCDTIINSPSLTHFWLLELSSFKHELEIQKITKFY